MSGVRPWGIAVAFAALIGLGIALKVAWNGGGIATTGRTHGSQDSEVAPVANGDNGMVGNAPPSVRTAGRELPDAVVLVRDETGDPVEGAGITVSMGTDSVILEESDSNGESKIPSEYLTGTWQVVARAADGRSAKSEIERGATSIELIVSDVGARISGTVRTYDGIAVSDATVVATRLFIDDADEKEPARDSIQCRTSSEGAFLLEGLELGSHYTITASTCTASTRVSHESSRVQAPDEEVSLTLHGLYGALIRFECEDEEYLAKMFGEPHFSLEHSRAMLPVSIRLSGEGLGTVGDCARRELGQQRQGYDCLLLFSLLGKVGAVVDDVICSGTMPGFDSFSVSTEVRPMLQGDLPVSVVRLTPNAEGAGTVKARITGNSSELAARMGLRAHLYLYRSAQEGREIQRFEYPISWGGSSVETEIEGVPAGEYWWGLTVDSGWLRVAGTSGGIGTRAVKANAIDTSAQSFSVVEDGASVLEIPLPELCYLEIDCQGSKGPVGARLMIADGPAVNGRVMGKRIRQVNVERSPTLIGPLAPRAYSIVPLQPSELPEGAHVVELKAGEVHREVLVFD